MQGLDFRKKRKKTEKKSGKRKRRTAKPELHFETEKKGLRFTGGRIINQMPEPKEIVWMAAEILIVCMAAVMIVAAFGQRVGTVGDSMAPVIRNGDVVLVNHFIYNIKNPKRGDIVVYRQKGDGAYSIKRVAGLPGEMLQITEGKILINGEEITDGICETDIADAGVAQEPVELGEDEYFVIGDNHTASDDSRNMEIGNIKKEDIYGTPWLIVSPWERFGIIG